MGCQCLKSKVLGRNDQQKSVKDTSLGLPIDRGWAWVIVAASCGIFGLPVGSLRITGILYLEMIDHFNSDQKMTLWVFSTRSLVTLFSGPLASLLLQRLSHRRATVLGTVLVSGGMIATAHAPTLEVAFVAYGLVYGFGAALLHVSALTCTGSYFDKHRGLAVGLTAAGGGVLAFVLPHLARTLFDYFTFEGALLVYGSLFLNLLTCAALLRPISQYLPKAPGHAVSHSEPPEAAAPAKRRAQVRDCCFQHKHQTDGSVSRGSALDCTVHATAGPQETCPSPRLSHVDGNAGAKGAGSLAKDGRAACGQSLLDWTLLRDERLWVMCAVMLFADNAFCVLYTAMPPYGDSIGVTRYKMATLLAIGGAFELVCRALHGWLSDRNVMPPLMQLGLCSSVTGCAALLCPILESDFGLALLSVVSGAAGTSIFSLNVPTTRWLLGADKMTSALGFQMFAQGIACVLSAFVTGYLTEMTGSWRHVFYYIGCNLLVASALALIYCLRLKLARQLAGASVALK